MKKSKLIRSKKRRSGRTASRRKLIIAIDGPAGSGKSSTAKALAARLHLPYVDSGAMYRCVTLKAMQEGISFDSKFDDKKRLLDIAKSCKIRLTTSPKGAQKVYLDGKDVSLAIREPALTQNVYHIAQEPLIRHEMVAKQKLMGKKDGAVMEGRDIGTVVFPKADYKFYFEANPDVRAKRRQRDLAGAGKKVAINKVLEDIQFRDKTDYDRKEGPLKKAKDAFLIDTSLLTIDETVDKIITLISNE